MNLFELFQTDKLSVSDRLQQTAIDFLTPLVAHRVPFVTVQQVVDELRDAGPGILVDRALVMSILDPEKIKVVQSIEGDRIIVERAKRHSTAEVHQALFADSDPLAQPPKTLAELKQGIRKRMQRHHAGG